MSAISCSYPNKAIDDIAIRSSSFADKLAEFDMAHQYLLLMEEEICLFFAIVFNVDILVTPMSVTDNKGTITVVADDCIMYSWDDIPVLKFEIISEEDGYFLQCDRLYEVETSYCC